MIIALEVYLESGETSTKSFFVSIMNGLRPLIIFARKLHRRFSTGLKICLCRPELQLFLNKIGWIQLANENTTHTNI